MYGICNIIRPMTVSTRTWKTHKSSNKQTNETNKINHCNMLQLYNINIYSVADMYTVGRGQCPLHLRATLPWFYVRFRNEFCIWRFAGSGVCAKHFQVSQLAWRLLWPLRCLFSGHVNTYVFCRTPERTRCAADNLGHVAVLYTSSPANRHSQN